jgi:hypothetical protein
MPCQHVISSVATSIGLDLPVPVLATNFSATAKPRPVNGMAAETFKVAPNASLLAFHAIRSATAARQRVSQDQLSVPSQFNPGKMILVSSRSAGEGGWTDRLVNLDVRQRIEDRPASDPPMTIDLAYDKNVPRYYGIEFAAA